MCGKHAVRRSSGGPGRARHVGGVVEACPSLDVHRREEGFPSSLDERRDGLKLPVPGGKVQARHPALRLARSDGGCGWRVDSIPVLVPRPNGRREFCTTMPKREGVLI